MKDPAAPFRKQLEPFNMKSTDFNRVMQEIKEGKSPIEVNGYRFHNLRIQKTHNPCCFNNELQLTYDKIEPI